MVDLHVHSNKSDGSLTPAELVRLAAEKGLSAFALTDHDTTEGLPEALAEAAGYNTEISGNPDALPLEVIPGIEFSTEYQGRDVHIVGLFIDYESPEFQTYLKDFVDSRILRNQKMCLSLASDGIDITYEKLTAEFPGAVITRSHFARYLYNHGYIKSLKEAFERYIGDHAKHFIPREKITPVQAVDLIRKAHGLSILAHPPLYRFSEEKLDALVSTMAEAGLNGIEAIYCTYNGREERQMRRLASKYHLAVSGGSDFHGNNKPGLQLATGYGGLRVPDTVLDDLKALLQNR